MINLFNDFGEFFLVLKNRNETLFYFGLLNLAIAAGLFLISRFIEIEYLGTHALYKPIKFALSTAAYSWAWHGFVIT